LATGIVELRLERPEAKNAIGKEMLQGLRSAIQEVEADTAANVVLVASSVPKVFCAGADLKVPAAAALVALFWKFDSDHYSLGFLIVRELC
jgi:enoyl-CoA hydratase/carnithine racemase